MLVACCKTSFFFYHVVWLWRPRQTWMLANGLIGISFLFLFRCHLSWCNPSWCYPVRPPRAKISINRTMHCVNGKQELLNIDVLCPYYQYSHCTALVGLLMDSSEEENVFKSSATLITATFLPVFDPELLGQILDWWLVTPDVQKYIVKDRMSSSLPEEILDLRPPAQ